MVLLRLRSDDGLVGLGEAVPLSMRGGAAWRRSSLSWRRSASGTHSTRRPCGAMPLTLSAPARCAALTALLDLRGRRAAGRRRPPPPSEPVECNATLVAGEPAAVAAEAARWAADGFATFKLKLGAATTSARCEPYARPSGRGAGSGSTPTPPGTWRRRSRCWPSSSRSRSSSPSNPWRPWRKRPRLRLDLDPDRRRREHREPRATRNGRSRWAPATLAGIKLSKVGGPEAAIEIAEVLPSFVSSALDGPVGIAAAAQVAQTLDASAPASRARPRPRPRHPAPLLLDDRLGRVRGTRRMLHLPDGPGLGVEIDEAALERPPALGGSGDFLRYRRVSRQ